MYQRDFSYLEGKDLPVLSIVLKADAFFYSLIDSNQKIQCHKSFLHISYSEPELVRAILLDENLRKKYQKISIAVLSGDSYFLPDMAHDLISEMPNLALKNKKMEKFLGMNVFTYFGITPHQELLLESLFGAQSYAIHHFANVLGAYYLNDDAPIFHVHVEENELYIYHQTNGALKFYNSFKTSSNTDVLYFILSVLDHCDISPADAKLHMSGWVEPDSQLFNLLNGYIGDIRVVNDSQWGLSENCDGLIQKPHYYFAHFALSVCAS